MRTRTRADLARSLARAPVLLFRTVFFLRARLACPGDAARRPRAPARQCPPDPRRSPPRRSQLARIIALLCCEPSHDDDYDYDDDFDPAPLHRDHHRVAAGAGGGSPMGTALATYESPSLPRAPGSPARPPLAQHLGATGSSGDFDGQQGLPVDQEQPQESTHLLDSNLDSALGVSSRVRAVSGLRPGTRHARNLSESSALARDVRLASAHRRTGSHGAPYSSDTGALLRGATGDGIRRAGSSSGAELGSLPLSLPPATREQREEARLKRSAGAASGAASAPVGASVSGPGRAFLERYGKGDSVDFDADCCPTCLEEYTAENPAIETACGHRFHLSCIYEWSNRSDACPICASAISFSESA